MTKDDVPAIIEAVARDLDEEDGYLLDLRIEPSPIVMSVG
jgi:hypothetical protein